MLLLAAIVVAAAIVWGAAHVARAVAAAAPRADRTASLLALFGPAIAQTGEDPRAYLAWQPLAQTARALFPAEFAALDRAAGGQFPFTSEQLQNAHARWTADWLAWERTHDAEFKLKAALLEQELGEAAANAYGRARLEAVEREKLERYQRRYEEYSRIARGLQGLVSTR